MDALSSVPLFHHVLTKHKLTMVGTLRKDKPQIPEMMITTKGRKQNTCVFLFDKELTLVSNISKNKSKKIVLVQSITCIRDQH